MKSGWAAAVLVDGPAASPSVVARHVVTLSDPAIPAARQPYHAAMSVARPDSPELDRLIASVKSYAAQSIEQLLDGIPDAGRRLRGTGLVVRSDIDPARIANPHIRAHACEGRLFRAAVEAALRSHDLPCTIFLERDLLARASEVLGRPAAALKQTLTELGRSVDGGWRRDDKAATLAAWLVLSTDRS